MTDQPLGEMENQLIEERRESQSMGEMGINLIVDEILEEVVYGTELNEEIPALRDVENMRGVRHRDVEVGDWGNIIDGEEAWRISRAYRLVNEGMQEHQTVEGQLNTLELENEDEEGIMRRCTIKKIPNKKDGVLGEEKIKRQKRKQEYVIQKNVSYKMPNMQKKILNIGDQKLSKVCGGRNLIETIVEVDKYNHSLWICEGDINEEYELTREELNAKTYQVTSLFEEIHNILNMEMIEETERDERFKMYLKTCFDGVQYVVNRMMEDGMWTFNPLSKFVWIYMMVGVRHEKRALKYLMHSRNYDKKCLTWETAKRESVIQLICKDRDMGSILSMHGLELGMFGGEDYVQTIPPIMYAIMNTEKYEYIMKMKATREEREDVIKREYSRGMTPFLFGCSYNGEVAERILESEYMDEKEFSRMTEGYTCLMLAALYNPQILKKLMESSYCTQEIVEKKHKKYGNILLIVARYNRKLLTYVLKSKYMSKNLLTGTMMHEDEMKTNILFECMMSISDIKKVIKSEYMTKEIMECTLKGNTILMEAMKTNTKLLQVLLRSEVCDEELMRYKNEETGETCVSIGLKMNEEGMRIMMDSPKFKKDMMEVRDKKGLNGLMILLSKRKIEKELKKRMYKKYMSTELLLQQDKNGINTYIYIANGDEKKAIELLKSEMMTEEVLNEKMIRKLYCICKGEILRHVRNSKYFEGMMRRKDVKTGRNILMEVSRNKCENMGVLIDSQEYTKKIVEEVDYKGNNILMMLIKRIGRIGSESAQEEIEKLLRECSTKELVNNENNKGETPLILACGKNEEVTRTILNSPLLDFERFTKKNRNGRNCFMEACKSGKITIIKTIGEHERLRESMYMTEDKEGRTVVYYALCGNEEMAEYILNHKYCSEELLEKGVTEWMNDSTLSEAKIKIILASPKCTTNILKIRSVTGSAILPYVIRNSEEISKQLIELDICTTEVMREKWEGGKTLLHICEKERIMKNIMDSEKIEEETLEELDEEGKMFYEHMLQDNEIEGLKYILSAIKNEKVLTKHNKEGLNIYTLMDAFKLTDYILGLPYVTPEGLRTQDRNGGTCMHQIVLSREINEQERIEELNKILESEKCTQELVSMCDKNECTLMTLYYNKHVMKRMLESEWFTLDMAKRRTKEGHNILTMAIVKDEDMVKRIMNHHKITGEILEGGENDILIPIFIATQIENASLRYILESEKCKPEHVNKRDKRGLTPLAYAIICKNKEAVKLILESQYDLSETFSVGTIESKSILMISAESTYEIFKMVMESAYVTKEMLLEGNEYNHNMMTYVFTSGIEIVKYMMRSEYWPELMYHTDVDDDFLLLYSRDKPDVIEYVLNNERCTKRFVAQENKLGMNISHYFASERKEQMKILLESPYCNEGVIGRQDRMGRTCLHISCETEGAGRAALEIVRSKYMVARILELQDNKGRNALMLALKHNPDVAEEIIDTGILTQEILKQTDKKGNNMMMYGVSEKVRKPLLQKLLNICDAEILRMRNDEQMTSVMYACKYNGEAVEELLKVCEPEMLCIGHTDYGSGITLAARYQPKAVKYILEWPKKTWSILNALEERRDFIKIGCVYNAESIKNALEAGVELDRYFTRNDREPAIILACRYQPEAVKYILESKYGTLEMLEIEREERCCMDEAFDYQPKALRYIIESEKSTEEYLNRQDNISGYRLWNKLHRVYNLSNLKNIAECEMTKYDNVATEEEEKLCEICLTYEKKVFFVPCGHITCVGCAFKLKKCHICRELIEKRSIIY